MKKINIHILYIFCLALLTYSCAVDSKNESSPQAAKSKNINNTFVNHDITQGKSVEDNLLVASQLIEQKLTDLEDYMNLLMEEDLPAEFTERINGQIENLLYLADSADTFSNNIKAWIQQRIDAGKEIKFSNINILKESVSYDHGGLIVNAELSLNEKDGIDQKLSFQFLLKKTDKKFGNKTRAVNQMKIMGVSSFEN